jgi:hypothetical protein
MTSTSDSVKQFERQYSDVMKADFSAPDAKTQPIRQVSTQVSTKTVAPPGECESNFWLYRSFELTQVSQHTIKVI